MASACPLSISTGSGWLLQNCASVCGPRLQVLLVCLLESAISHLFQRILRMFSKFTYYAFTHLARFPTVTGDVSVTQEKRFLPHSLSSWKYFPNSYTLGVMHHVKFTTSCCIICTQHFLRDGLLTINFLRICCLLIDASCSCSGRCTLLLREFFGMFSKIAVSFGSNLFCDSKTNCVFLRSTGFSLLYANFDNLLENRCGQS